MTDAKHDNNEHEEHEEHDDLDGPIILDDPGDSGVDLGPLPEPYNPEGHRCGFVTLVGQPNAGKSTLMNRLLGEKLAIVTPKPQTTRDQIRGVLTLPDKQLVFIDTPGVHKAKGQLNRAMVGAAIEALESVDLVILVVDARRALGAVSAKGSRHKSSDGMDGRVLYGDRRIVREIQRCGARYIVVLNKVDVVKKPQLLPVMQAYNSLPGGGAIMPVSAKTSDGLGELVDLIAERLPEGPRAYDADALTDRTLRFLCAELIREQVFLRTHQEVPYGVAVEIEVFEELPEVTNIAAVVHVERTSQRGILIGKGGLMMKEIATHARSEMQKMLGGRVFLEVLVRVEANWTERVQALRRFGYGQR